MVKISFLALLVCCLLPMTGAMREPNSANPSIASKPGFVFNKDSLLRNFNDQRRKFAKEKRFARMFELEWDDSLAKKSEKHDDDGLFKKNRRYFDWPQNEETLDYMEQWYFKYLGELEYNLTKDSYTDHLGYHELLLPGQKRIGCSQLDFDYWEHKFNMWCFLAPEGLFNSYGVVNGKAGSDCGPKYYNKDGLCAHGAPNTSTTSTTTTLTPTTTIETTTAASSNSAIIAVSGIIIIVIIIGVSVFCVLGRRKKQNTEPNTIVPKDAKVTKGSTVTTRTNKPKHNKKLQTKTETRTKGTTTAGTVKY